MISTNNIRKASVSHIRLVITALSLLLMSSSVFSSDIPGWLRGPTEIQTNADPDGQVWVVYFENPKDPFGSIKIAPARVYNISSGHQAIFDTSVEVRESGRLLRHDNHQLKYLIFYNQYNFSTSGSEATTLNYRPYIFVENGKRYSAEDVRNFYPEGLFNVSQYRYRNLTVGDFNQTRAQYSSWPYPILAIAWNEKNANQAKKRILYRSAQQTFNRLFIPWNKNTRVFLPSGAVSVESGYEYTVTRDGRYDAWGEETIGKVYISVNGRREYHDFKHRCFDTTHRYQHRNTVFCSQMPQVRVNLWRDPPINSGMSKIYFDQQGLTIFYPTGQEFGREAMPQNTDIQVRINIKD